MTEEERHLRTDPACSQHRRPRGRLSTRWFDRHRGRMCPPCGAERRAAYSETLLTELYDIGAALKGEKPFPRTEIGNAVHNLRGRAEAAELALAQLRAVEPGYGDRDENRDSKYGGF